MAASSRRSSTSVAERLERDGHRFDFFQAVRLLQRLSDQQDAAAGHRERQSVGQDAPPQKETIRFSTTLSSNFPAAAVAAIDLGSKSSRKSPSPNSDGPIRVTVNFMGLTGPQGVLPEHFNRLLIEQHRANNDRLAKFHDLFNHRMISLFYRAWEKYQFPVRYERAKLLGESDGIDPFTQCLLSLVGMGTEGLRDRLSLDDETFIYYGGHFATQVRNADGLADLLSDDLGVPVEIEQFRGQWLALSEEDRTRLTSTPSAQRRTNKLGANIVLGTKIWDVQNRFRVVLGPMAYPRYLRLIPEGDSFKRLCEIVHSYAGLQFDFDVQPILKADQVPTCRLGQSGDMPQLGRNVFIGSKPLDKDFRGAMFDGGRVYNKDFNGLAELVV